MSAPWFLCDEMLARLARWLRAAGYDVEVAAEGEDDSAIVKRAVETGRRLLTCDHEIMQRRRLGGTGAVLLPAASLEEQVRELCGNVDIDWLLAPFTRCLVDNQLLQDAAPEAIAELRDNQPGVEPPFKACPVCARVYWRGGHTERMLERLQKWSGKGGDD